MGPPESQVGPLLVVAIMHTYARISLSVWIRTL